jgi:hypothetical protein
MRQALTQHFDEAVATLIGGRFATGKFGRLSLPRVRRNGNDVGRGHISALGNEIGALARMARETTALIE